MTMLNNVCHAPAYCFIKYICLGAVLSMAAKQTRWRYKAGKGADGRLYGLGS